jgi:hypothetical protein
MNKFKKFFASVLVFLLIIYPMIPVLVYAEESLETGTAVSAVTAVSEVNTTEINAQVETVVIPVSEQTDETITPFPLPTPTAESSTATATPSVSIVNNAQVGTVAEVAATTGGNTQVSTDSAKMTTGDAATIATAVSLTNSTLVNSSLEVGVIAVLDTWYGDIILDPPSQARASGENSAQMNGLDVHNEETSVVTIASASADTGNNSQQSEIGTTMTTGQAIALSQSNAIVNTTLVGADVFTFLPENIWLWSGTIRNWEYPGSVSFAQPISNLNISQGSQCGDGCNTNLSVDNQAQVTTVAMASSSTGSNSQVSGGEASMTTGNAYAGAVATSVVNTTLIDSRYRLLSLLLFAPWGGDLVFAYPDLSLSALGPPEVKEGEDIVYEVIINNEGDASAREVSLNLVVSDESQIVYEANEGWEAQKPEETVKRTFTVPTNGKAGQTLVLKAMVTNATSEESRSNNQATTRTKILASPETAQKNENSASSTSTEVPKLRLSSKNNIHEFVYPGDQVTYDMTVYNDGPVRAKNIVLIQYFFTPDGEKISQFQGKVGNLAVNGHKDIRFLMQTGTSLSAGNYYTESHVVGQSEEGVTTTSNIVRNGLELRLRATKNTTVLGATTQAAEALTPAQEEILGAALAPKNCQECLSFPWYIAITLGSIFYYLICRRQIDYSRAIRWGLALPLSAYAGLIMSNPDCVNGIVILPSASGWCQWFLPLAYLIYFVIMGTRPLIMRVREKLFIPAQATIN